MGTGLSFTCTYMAWGSGSAVRGIYTVRNRVERHASNQTPSMMARSISAMIPAGLHTHVGYGQEGDTSTHKLCVPNRNRAIRSPSQVHRPHPWPEGRPPAGLRGFQSQIVAWPLLVVDD